MSWSKVSTMAAAPDPSPLSFLEEQASTGTFDSEGQFTLSAHAVTKMARHSFQDDSLWLLRVVQAAVVSGAESVSVKHTNKATEIAFEPGTPFDVEEVRAYLGSPDQNLQSAVSLLASGLQAVGVGQGREFTVDFIDSRSHRYLAFLSREVHGGEGRSRIKSPNQRVKARIRFVGDYRGPVALESTALTVRARACPVTVKLDGRVVNNLSPHNKKQPNSDVSYLGLGAVTGPAGGDTLQEFWAPRAVYTGESWALTDKFTDSRPVLKMKVPVGPVQVLFQMFYTYKFTLGGKNQPSKLESKPTHSKVHWLRHGLISETENLPWQAHAVSVQLYIDATDLPSDASGFAIRGSVEEKESRRKEALRLIGAEIREVQGALERLWARPFGNHMLAVSGFLGLHSLCFPGPLKLIHLGMLGAAAVALSGEKRSVLQACRDQLRMFAARFPD